MYKVLILEDEKYTRRYLKQILLEVPLVGEVLTAATGSEAIALVQKHSPHVAMLDIELQDDQLNGIEYAKMMYNLSPETNFVFVTGYAKYALESFAVHPYEYILKPVKKEKIIETLSSLMRKMANEVKTQRPNKIIVKDQTETFLLSLDEIIFIERIENITKVHTRENIVSMSQTLNEIERSLTDNFLRVHQSYIVNEEKVSKITLLGNRSYEMEFAGYKGKAQMSRYRYQELKDRFTPSF